MTTITKALVENRYEIDEAQFRELVETRLAAGEVDKSLTDGYFKVLLRRTQQRIQSPTTEDRLRALEEADGTMYPIVIEVINKQDDCKPDANDSREVKQQKAKLRNERSNYARSAKSVIRKAINAGLAIEEYNVVATGKSFLERLAATKIAESSEYSVPKDYVASVDLARKLVDKLANYVYKLKPAEQYVVKEYIAKTFDITKSP